MTEVQKSANPTVALLQERQEALAKFVGKDKIERFMASVLASLRKETKLLKCEPGSFFAAAHQAASLNLSPGPLGHVYMVPYGRQATLILGYKGMLELARRHPMVALPIAKVVYEGEVFEYDQASSEIIHPYTKGVDRSDENLIGAYMQVVLKNGYKSALFLERDQIEERRARSPAAQSNFWKNDYAAMCRKTAIRAHCNGGEVPLSTDLQAALEYEAEFERKVELTQQETYSKEPVATNIEIGFDVEEEDPDDPFVQLANEPLPPRPKKKVKKVASDRDVLLSEIASEAARLKLKDHMILNVATQVLRDTHDDPDMKAVLELENLAIEDLMAIHKEMAST